MPGRSRRLAYLVSGAAAVSAMVITTSPMISHAAPQAPEPGGPTLSAAEALAEGSGTDVATAQRKLDREAGQNATAQRLLDRLGDQRTGGAWITTDGTLKVAVTDASAADEVSKAGGSPVTVKRDLSALRSVADGFDRAGKAGSIDDVQSWGIDPATNTVVIKTRGLAKGGAADRLVADSAGAVRVETTQAVVTPTADLIGGREYSFSSGGQSYVCSAGFGARDGSGNGVMITAGHCVEGASNFRMDGVSLGTVRGFSFPVDDSAALNLSSSWTPTNKVSMYNGSNVSVTGSQVAAVGATLCKSGRTTGWTCGQVVSFDNSVNYGNGDIVYGLTEHDACVEQGDSGGANVSGSQAQGLSSGGALYQSGGRLVCGEKVGQANVSYFQPVNEALSQYGATLVTS